MEPMVPEFQDADMGIMCGFAAGILGMFGLMVMLLL